MHKNIKKVAGWEIGEIQETQKSPFYCTIQAPLRCPRTGAEQVFTRFSLGDWVNILAITPEKQIIMVRQFRFGTERIEWELPGGLIEQGEDPEEAGLRELEEETGYIGENNGIIGKISPNPAIQDNTLYTVLVCNALQNGTISLDPMEKIETHCISFTDIITMLKRGEIDHGFTYNALMHYALHSDMFTLGT